MNRYPSKNHVLGFTLALGLGCAAFINADYPNYSNQNASGYQSNGYNQNNGYNGNQNNGYNNGYSNESNNGYQNTSGYQGNEGYANDRNSNNQNSNYQANDGYNNNYQRNADGTVVSDQDLSKQIQDKIGAGWFSKGYDQVSAQVNNGNVTLTGTVKTLDDKQKVEKEIRNLTGVKSLNSQITVQEQNPKDAQKRQFPQDTSASSVDDQLNKKIRDNVSKGWLWDNYKNVSLNTSNGIVTLEGTIDNVDDQQKLINELQKIDGVKAVKSNLRFTKS